MAIILAVTTGRFLVVFWVTFPHSAALSAAGSGRSRVSPPAPPPLRSAAEDRGQTHSGNFCPGTREGRSTSAGHTLLFHAMTVEENAADVMLPGGCSQLLCAHFSRDISAETFECIWVIEVYRTDLFRFFLLFLKLFYVMIHGFSLFLLHLHDIPFKNYH